MKEEEKLKEFKERLKEPGMEVDKDAFIDQKGLDFYEFLIETIPKERLVVTMPFSAQELWKRLCRQDQEKEYLEKYVEYRKMEDYSPSPNPKTFFEERKDEPEEPRPQEGRRSFSNKGEDRGGG